MNLNSPLRIRKEYSSNLPFRMHAGLGGWNPNSAVPSDSRMSSAPACVRASFNAFHQLHNKSLKSSGRGAVAAVCGDSLQHGGQTGRDRWRPLLGDTCRSGHPPGDRIPGGGLWS
ncbi:unnamed protein product [Boreogadus saida]